MTVGALVNGNSVVSLQCVHFLKRYAFVAFVNLCRQMPQCCDVLNSSTKVQSVSLYLASARVTLRIDGQRTCPLIGEFGLNSAPESTKRNA